MSTALTILVVILGVFLAIFLILGILIFAYAYKLTKKAKKLEAKVAESVNDAQGFMNNVKNTAAPMIIGKIISSNLKNYTKKSKVKVKK